MEKQIRPLWRIPSVKEIAKFCRAFVAPQIFIRRHCQAMTRSIIVVPSWRTASNSNRNVRLGFDQCSAYFQGPIPCGWMLEVWHACMFRLSGWQLAISQHNGLHQQASAHFERPPCDEIVILSSRLISHQA